MWICNGNRNIKTIKKQKQKKHKDTLDLVYDTTTASRQGLLFAPVLLQIIIVRISKIIYVAFYHLEQKIVRK